MMRVLKGTGVSGRLIVGRAHLHTMEKVEVEKGRDIEEEREILRKATAEAEDELKKLAESMKGREEAGIMEAQILMLRDPALIERTKELMEKEHFSAAYSIKTASEESAKTLEGLKNPYLRERASDVRDVGDRIVKRIRGKNSGVPHGSIVVAEELKPSEVVQISSNAIGFAAERGSRTSHVAILASALNMPAVLGVKNLLGAIREGDTLALDGERGEVMVDPDVKRIEEEIRIRDKEAEDLERIKMLPAVTADGRKIEVMANIGGDDEASAALESGADGVGLFRTEFLLLNRSSSPDEEEQFIAYKKVAETFGEKPVIIRTFDIGGDKTIDYLNIEREDNPFLGVRGIRFCLMNRGLFKTQLRAILRASAHGNVKLMYPMVALEEEAEKADEVLNEAKGELEREGYAFNNGIEVGMMVEIPSAALNAGRFEVDFYSVGSNDLIQYTMAADRTNEVLSYLYRPDKVMKLIEGVVASAHEKGRTVGVCGEMAGDPDIIPELISIGVDELSMSPSKIARAKKVIIPLRP